MIHVILRRLLIPVLSIAVLTGLFLLGHLLAAFQSDGLSPNQALMSEIASASLSWGYALASGVLFIAFLIWAPSQLPVWRLLITFRRVDSAALDGDDELCQRFYRALLAFRCHFGEKRFLQRIVGRFNFYYEYHNDALRWMINIARQVDSASIPVNMIIDSICSGHIGRVFSGCRYGGGLPSAFVRIDEPVFLLARMDSVEIWSSSSRAPICVFTRHTLRLEPNLYQQQSSGVSLSGVEKSSRKIRQLELRIPAPFTHEQQSAQISPQDHIAALESWLIDLLPAALSPQENFGIDVAEFPATEASDQATHAPLLDMLQRMLGTHIDAIFSEATLSIADPDIMSSIIVLCGGLGIITIRDVPLTGTIYYSGEPHWIQIDTGNSQRFANACLAAQHSKNALNNRLATAALNRWPVYNLVVFSHADVQPELELGQLQVQCDVITLGQLPKWFASQSTDDRIRFTKDDYNEFITLLDPLRLQHEQIKQA